MTPREGVEPVAWVVVDKNGRTADPIEHAEFYATEADAQFEVSACNECWMNEGTGEGREAWGARKPFRVVPLYAHPAATAREEAWKALLAYAECEQSLESPTTDAMYATLARHGWVEGTPPIRFVMDLRAKALALARSTGGAS